MKKIGLFGGTFDPVHTGHLIVAQAVRELSNFETVIFIPSANPPHKGADIMFTAEERFKMLSLAVMGDPYFRISTIEMDHQCPSYTIDTIREIKASISTDTELAFILGKDNLTDIITWKEPQAILDECKIIVADRPGTECGEIPGWLSGRIETVCVPLIQISSSDIRRRIREGKNIRYMVPDAVADVIEKKFGLK